MAGNDWSPTDAQLRAFERGQLAAPERAAVAEWLARAPGATDRLRRVVADGLADSAPIVLGPPDAGDGAAADQGVFAARRVGALLGAVGDGERTPTPWPREYSTLNEVPSAIREYRIVRELGRGGMGQVYLARHTRLQRDVALKLLPVNLAVDPLYRGRFDREMAALGRLDHPNLVRAFDAGAEGSYLFLVMELLTGRDLNHLLQERGPLPPAEAAELIRQAALGLHCAHEAGLVHRDVKPSNLFVTAAGVVKVIDLGLARVTDPDQAGQRLSSKIVLGTPDYLAPEQWQRGDVDRRADLYSLGCTLVHLLTGKPPFAERGRNWLQLLDAHRHAPPPDLTALRPGVPQGLADLIVRLLAKDPADRPATALEVVAALAPLATGVGLPTDVTQRLTPPPPGLAPPAPPPRPPRRLLALLGIGVAALAGLALWFATRPPEGAPSTPAAASPTAAAPAVLTAVRTLKTHRGGVLALAYSPDGKVLASGGKDQTIYLHNTATWKASPPLTGHPSDVIGLAFRPDGTRLASVTSGDDQCAIRLWDVATGQAAGTLGNPGRGQFAVAYSPDGQALACGGWDRVLRVFDVATGRERFPPPVVTPRLIRGLAFAPGGGMVATGGNGRTRLWDAATGAEIRSDLPVDLNPTFLPGGQELVGWTYVEGRVTICAVPSGEVRLTWPAHASEIEGLAVSPGGRFLTSVGKDGLAKVWATADGREVATLKGHRGSVYVAAFSPDARQVATGGAGDFTVQIWDLPAECWVR